ncbi:MAG TPA: DUF4214 domain-containing protein, partial [Candidatus Obscuribacterales bacterium]
MATVASLKHGPRMSQPVSDEAFVVGLYRRFLGREPDPAGMQNHLAGLRQGVSRQQIQQNFVNSPEFKQRKSAYAQDGFQRTQVRPAWRPAQATAAAPKQGFFQRLWASIARIFSRPKTTPVPVRPVAPAPVAPPVPVPVAPPPPPLPGAGLSTVPITAEMAAAPVDRSSPNAAVLSAATWLFNTHHEFFTASEDRPTALRMMTLLIGALRAHGFDAHRVVNYPNQPVGDPGRYGKEALVLNGRVFDCYFSWGSPESRPQALDVGA